MFDILVWRFRCRFFAVKTKKNQEKNWKKSKKTKKAKKNWKKYKKKLKKKLKKTFKQKTYNIHVKGVFKQKIQGNEKMEK